MDRERTHGEEPRRHRGADRPRNRIACKNGPRHARILAIRTRHRKSRPMQATGPVETDIVLLGAGHAHVEVLRRFAMRPERGARLTLIGREPETPYSGMLPGLIRGDYSFEQAHIDLAPLAVWAGARLLIAEAT